MVLNKQTNRNPSQNKWSISRTTIAGTHREGPNCERKHSCARSGCLVHVPHMFRLGQQSHLGRRTAAPPQGLQISGRRRPLPSCREEDNEDEKNETNQKCLLRAGTCSPSSRFCLLARFCSRLPKITACRRERNVSTSRTVISAALQDTRTSMRHRATKSNVARRLLQNFMMMSVLLSQRGELRLDRQDVRQRANKMYLFHNLVFGYQEQWHLSE